MTPSYKITTDNLTVDDVIAQLRSINEYPCVVSIYDRTFKMLNSGECWALCHGLEIGRDISLDEQENKIKVANDR